MGGVKSTKENLLLSAEGETYEIENMYPKREKSPIGDFLFAFAR